MARWRTGVDRVAVGKQLNSILEQLKSLASQGDYPAFHQMDQQFHRVLVDAAGLPSLSKSWGLVAADLSEWILEVKEVYWPNLMALYQEHVLLFEAWKSEDGWVAEEATHQHLEAGWYRIAVASGQDHGIDPVERAVAFISTHFSSHLEMEWVARHVSFLSTSHFNRLFRERTGEAPYRFLRNVRLDHAAQLLRSGPDAVAMIAQRVGYRNASHFVRDFRAKFGTTPLAYRRQGA
ncbi:MAG: helix-turn-helix domain-containing protein [Kiritimatiellales bacterium]|nr:helix-turn-helix domain-containing protein [Kiritimatiellales bacterium]